MTAQNKPRTTAVSKSATSAAGFPAIFDRIRKLMLPYGKIMDARVDKPAAYQLYIVGDIELAGRPFKECYFAGVVIQKTMVAFYSFPIYTHPKALTIPQAIQKNLKGKSCFNFRKLDVDQEAAIGELLAAGAALYKKEKILLRD